MKTYEVYAVVRVTEDTLKNVSLDTIQDVIRKELANAGWPADDVWVEEEEDKADLDQEYQCPDCNEVCWGYELVYPTAEGTMYVCPHCGCIQEENNIVAQLGDKE